MAKKTTKTSKKKASAKKVVAKKATLKTKKAVTKKRTAKKKTVKKKDAPKTTKKVVRRPKKTKNPLTSAEVNHYKMILLQKRAELIGDVNNIENEALKKSRHDASGDLSNMPIHMADIGTDNFEQEFSIGLMDGERKLLCQINEALDRIEKKTYGICEGMNKVISKARLNAIPWAKYCIEYARMVEQNLVSEGDIVFDEEQDYFEDVEPDKDQDVTEEFEEDDPDDGFYQIDYKKLDEEDEEEF